MQGANCLRWETEIKKIARLSLEKSIKDYFLEKGFTDLYPPQQAAIKTGVLDGKNVVLAIPTASGKTLIAELCMLKAIVEGRGKALYLCPLRALASEKYDEFRPYSNLGVNVGITIGDYDTIEEKYGAYDLLICTNERADSLLRHRAKWLSDIAIVIADEVHLINDPGRGPTLEVVLARLRQIAPHAQILALSATVDNADELAEWIDGTAVVSDWRPVTLREGVYHDGRVYFDEGEEEKYVPATSFPIGDITRRVLKKKGQLLAFLNTRRSAVRTAQKLSSITAPRLSQKEQSQLGELAENLLHLGEVTQVTENLSRLLRAGVAFHHAGLRYSERKLIEEAFRNNYIKAVCATPTLAAGMNLPARVVVIQEYRRFDRIEGYKPIPVLEYKQMAGRAGRPKYDTTGTAILIARNEGEREFLLDYYTHGTPESIISKLASESALRSHVLSTIAMNYASDKAGIMDFIRQTFFGHQRDPDEVEYMIDLIIQFLKDENLLEQQNKRLFATSFGRRVSQLYVDPKSAVVLRDGLAKAMKQLEHTTDMSYLHLISHTPDMPNLYLRRGEDERFHDYVIEHIDEFLTPIPDPRIHRERYEFFLAEVKTALLAKAWIEELPEDQLINQFKIGSGDLLRLVDTQKWLIYTCHELAPIFGYRTVVPELEELELRIRYGVRRELTDLVELQGIGRVRARFLFRAGYISKNRIRDAPLAQLAAVPTIGSQIAQSIKQQCGGVIKPEEEQALKDTRQQTTRQTQLFLD
ncbi:MAG: DEAD/DEAH box helicase [Promethearchaeota archaeon]